MATQSREIALDAIRGLVIYTILVDNVTSIGMSYTQYQSISQLEGTVWAVLNGLFNGRFLFYILFGMSIGYAYVERKTFPTGQYVRRSAALLLLGLFNYFILQWQGDILMSFGIVSLLIIPVLRYSGKTILGLAVLIGGMFYLSMHYVIIMPLMRARDAVDAASIGKWAEMMASVQDKASLKSTGLSGGYFQSFVAKVDGIGSKLTSLAVTEIPEALCVVLIGVGLYKVRFISIRTEYHGLMGAVFTIVGVGWCIKMYYGYFSSGFEFVQFEFKYICFEYFIGRIFLSLGYGCGIIYLYRTRKVQRIIEGLAISGRYALTNYLLQTFLLMLVFVAMRLHGKLALFEMYLVMSLVAILMVVSNWYLHKNKLTGPVEAVARSMYKA